MLKCFYVCHSMCLTWLYLKKLCFSELLVNMCMESAIITSNDLAICSVHKLLSVSVLLCRQLLIQGYAPPIVN